MNGQGALRLGFLLYLAFVVYGSLIPFEYRAHTVAEALDQFVHIPWLDLGITSRADWVANLVLYIPLAFLGSAALTTHSRSATTRHLLAGLVFFFCLLLALAVEFTQIFFGPRTVSLNDLLAETLGSLCGALLWIKGHHRFNRLWQAFRSGGRQSLLAAIAGYGALYLALALFPFDFLVSRQDLGWKLNSDLYAWFLASGTANPLRTIASLLSEIAAIGPLGILIGLLAPRASLRRSFAAGAITGVVLEAIQFLLASGVSQGASILARGVGLALGVVVGRQTHQNGLLSLAHWVRRLAPMVLPIYLLTLAAASGWLSKPLLGTSEALASLAGVHLLPFYYHYYTSESVAMVSLLANLGMYAPLGIYAWARQAGMPGARRRGAWQAVMLALLVALPIELSKLWLGNSHPDFTNLLIGATGAVLSYALAGWLTRTSEHPEADVGDSLSVSDVPPPAATPADRPHRLHLVFSVTSLTVLLLGLWHYPLVVPLAALLLLAYGLLLWRRPWAWLFVLPALLPVLDLAPYTGRLLLDEFDLLILVTLGIGYWRILPSPPSPWANTLYPWATALLLVSGLIAIAMGLKPILDGTPASIDHSHSPLETLQVGKGLAWALLLLPLLRRIPASDLVTCRQWLINGLAAGLALLSLVVLWERHRFVGLMDFEGVFRVSGNFSSMNNGGAYIEAFIAIAFPALAVWTLQQTRPLLRLFGIVLAALASYALLVTFSRGGYAGLAVGLSVVALGVWRSRGRRRGPLLAGLLLAVVAAATPVLLGGFAQGRLAQVKQDLQVRLDHWAGAIELMEPGLLPALTGTGFGQYPARYLWQADVTRPPGTFAVRHEQGNAFLRLGSGDAYYLDQIVQLDPDKHYTLHARVRFQGDLKQLQIPLCEKALLYSFKCNWHQLRRPDKAAPDGWHELSAQIQTAGLGESSRWPSPTLKFSLAAPTDSGAVDIDGLSLRDSEGREWLDNGDFEDGLAHWLSATDRDLAWHIHQTPLEIYFAQGLLGLAAILLTLIAAGRTMLPALRRGESFAIALTGGLAGFLTVGLLGSTLDVARLSLLFYLLCFASWTLANRNLCEAPHDACHEAKTVC